jgi:DNA-3-methyladenine glycosylase II
MEAAYLTHFKAVDPILYKKALEFEPITIKPLPNNQYFARLCDIIISQQLSDRAATTIYQRFVALFEGQDIHPERLSEIPEDLLRSAGLSRAKVASIRDLSKSIIDKRIDIEHISVDKLLTIKGIGPWSIEMFMISAIGDEDVFSAGDLGLRNAIKILYSLSENPTKEELLKISAVWSPYRSYACRVLWKSLNITPNTTPGIGLKP